MPAVFVHGVPETTRVWDKVRAELGDVETVALALPGFGVPVPDGFGASMNEYADWLLDEVATIDGPVDLVGHDWGALLTARVASLRPEMLRSWAVDCISAFDPDWEWHDVAKIWQTPGAGEEFVATQRKVPAEDVAPAFVGFGVPEDDAIAMLRAADERMDGCILTLYRSATNIHEEWGPDLADVPAPGLMLLPTEDPFTKPELAPRATKRAGARFETLDGVGHWWLYQDPAPGARALRDFWGSL
jgi:pimeloyl-ACP methyl ester carboxylesterase